MNMDVAKIFSILPLSEKTVQIKLLGDSITNGDGGTGCRQNGEPITASFFRNPDGYCWAKLLKDCLEEQFDCKVINNSCSGTNIRFIIDRFDELVSPEDDIVLCSIGTNNRHQHFSQGPRRSRRAHLEMVYNDILELYGKFRAANKQVVFIANIPAVNEASGDYFWRNIHMNDIHDLYVKAACVCGFPLMDLYTAMQDYCESRDVPLGDLLVDGLHPNDRGYEVMFRLILKEIGIARKINM